MCRIQITMKAVAIFSLISGNAFWKSSLEPIELSNINTVSFVQVFPSSNTGLIRVDLYWTSTKNSLA